eukprot:CAMPEP_0197180120 /NCGR_PEP_ID=MMETSP1423-20130617/4838_1 /TAXON_ID=476441 /ORGANISM="Pseudo-nitzschia heimii, Strain UNC1101" /LENGTH=512 /DNA_ID=CAMNT_0042630141 /DNA_START=491 /DNA_END=2029 /DNA_ORIENTATION=+
MADIILRKTDPFVLDQTIGNLEKISPNFNSSGYGCLPLGSNPGGSGPEDRPFLETPFNKVDAKKYRKPGEAASGSSSSSGGEKDILDLEQTADEVWSAYRELYYGHDAVGSVYVRRKGADPRTAGTPSKMKKSGGGGGALEALFGIQKTCRGEDGGEIARWDSVHTVAIEVPNFEKRTCEYKIKSAVWCRYKPEDVGDVPRAERVKPAAPLPKKAEAFKKPSSPSKKKAAADQSKLDIARLEVFDRAANQWDSNKNRSSNGGGGSKSKEPEPLSNSAPIPAVVTSSAVYTKDTVKVCKLRSGATSKKPAGIPAASHIENIGSLLEKIETDFRSKLERVDAPKCVEVLQGMYRPSLSPGLKLPSGGGGGNGSMISKLGGHATGMGVGKGLIGEIALKAKSKGLGDSPSTTTNKAMEGILANEKKKLQDLDDAKSGGDAPETWNRGSLKKASSFGPLGNRKPLPRTPGQSGLKRPNLRKATSVRTFSGPSSTTSSSPTPEFMNFRNKLKRTAAK